MLSRETQETIRARHDIAHGCKSGKGCALVNRNIPSLRAVSASKQLRAFGLQPLHAFITDTLDAFVHVIQIHLHAFCQCGACKLIRAIERFRLWGAADHQPQLFPSRTQALNSNLSSRSMSWSIFIPSASAR